MVCFCVYGFKVSLSIQKYAQIISVPFNKSFQTDNMNVIDGYIKKWSISTIETSFS